MQIQLARLVVTLQQNAPRHIEEQSGYHLAILYLAGELHASGEEDACWMLIHAFGLENSSYASRLRAAE